MNYSRLLPRVLCWIALLLPVAAAGIQTNSPTLYPVNRDGKWGYCDRSGKVIIPFQFEDAEPFSEGMAKVGRNDDSFSVFIDTQGKVVTRPLDTVSSRFSEGLIPVRTDGKIGYANKQGEIVIAPKFDDGGDFSEGLAPVRMGELWGYIDREQRMVIPPQFTDADSFHDGMASASIIKNPIGDDASLSDTYLMVMGRRRGEYAGYINRSGTFVIEPQFARAHPFSEGRAAVAVDSGKPLVRRWDIIDKSGKVVFTVRLKPTDSSDAHEFSEGLIAVKVDSKWGYMDTDGRVVIAPQFEYAHEFTDGLARVGVGTTKFDFPYRGLSTLRISFKGKWGYIDRTGKFVSDKLSWKSK
jgi:hypothetical protein